MEDMQVRDPSVHTQDTYVQQVSQFVRISIGHRNFRAVRRFAPTPLPSEREKARSKLNHHGHSGTSFSLQNHGP